MEQIPRTAEIAIGQYDAGHMPAFSISPQAVAITRLIISYFQYAMSYIRERRYERLDGIVTPYTEELTLELIGKIILCIL